MTEVSRDTADCMAKLDEHESSVYQNKADILKNKIRILETEVRLARLDKDMTSYDIKERKCRMRRVHIKSNIVKTLVYRCYDGLLMKPDDLDGRVNNMPKALQATSSSLYRAYLRPLIILPDFILVVHLYKNARIKSKLMELRSHVSFVFNLWPLYVVVDSVDEFYDAVDDVSQIDELDSAKDGETIKLRSKMMKLNSKISALSKKKAQLRNKSVCTLLSLLLWRRVNISL